MSASHSFMNRKNILPLAIALVLACAVLYILPRYTKYHVPLPEIADKKKDDLELQKIQAKAVLLKMYAAEHKYSTSICFLADMSLPSGKNRFFVYDLNKNKIRARGLVAHGSAGKYFATNVYFSNKVNSYCTSEGMYKIGGQYQGNYSISYKLFGLDSTNNNAFERNVVLHAYTCVPERETYPQPICNSQGCPMVSHKFLDTLSTYIKNTKGPMLLWVFK